MPLNTRSVKVTIHMPGGDVVLDQSINMHIKVHKAALAIQSRAIIDVIGLNTAMRQTLLSQFTAWNARQVATGQLSQDWINIEISAGYLPYKGAKGPKPPKPSTIFKGQVALCEPTSAPPNMGVRITAFTHQVDRTGFVSAPAPDTMTFKDYVTWAAGQMGFGSNFVCDTSFNDVIINNPARSITVLSALLIDIQNKYRPDVAAFVDDDLLIVKDRNKILNPAQTVTVDTFIGTPQWTEWGVDLTTMLDSTIKLAQGVKLKSLMNPSLNQTFVVLELEYDIATRDVPFYVKVGASPPA